MSDSFSDSVSIRGRDAHEHAEFYIGVQTDVKPCRCAPVQNTNTTEDTEERRALPFITKSRRTRRSRRK